MQHAKASDAIGVSVIDENVMTVSHQLARAANSTHPPGLGADPPAPATSNSGTWGSGIRDGLFLEQSLIKLTALNIRREF
jgi:hypothetical protein